MKTLHLRVTLATGNDDLRAGSTADFLVKIEGIALPLEQRHFVGTGGLPPRSTRSFDLRFAVPDSFQPRHLENVQIRHVSHESFGQTADNWDLRVATVDIMPAPQPATRIAVTREAKRFDGGNRVLILPSLV